MPCQKFTWLCSGFAVAAALVLRTEPSRAEPRSPWGVSPSHALTGAPETWTKAMAAAGATSVRGFRANSTLAQLAPYRAAKLELSGILMWSHGSVLTLPVDDLESFRRYVAETVSRYRGVVTHWEVWNEPPNFTKDVSPQSYARVVAASYEAAKEVAPEVKIGIAAKSVHLRYLAEAIASGARDKFDFVSLHPYETAGLVSQGCDRPFLGIVGNVRAMLRDVDPERANVPIWFSEVGVELSSRGRFPIDEARQADALIKIYTMSIAQGVERVSWFDPRDSEGKKHGLERADGSARPAYEAYRRLRFSLGSSPRFKGYVSLTPDSLGFLFESADNIIVVAWLLSSSVARQVKLDTLATVLEPASGREDTTTVVLSASPRIITAPAGSSVARAWREHASQVPPPNAPNSPGELTLTAGEPARGICMDNAPVAETQFGVRELSLTGSVGAWFAIDPQFAGYSSEPLDIEMVARSHGKGTPGFNFKYESRAPLTAANDHGMTGAGQWNFVTSTTPVAFHWSVDNASFSGKYGTSIAFECDSPDHCDFGIVTLKIRKRRQER